MSTCANCGREALYYRRAHDDGKCWAAVTGNDADKLDCERAAHARTRAELESAQRPAPLPEDVRALVEGLRITYDGPESPWAAVVKAHGARVDALLAALTGSPVPPAAGDRKETTP